MSDESPKPDDSQKSRRLLPTVLLAGMPVLAIAGLAGWVVQTPRVGPWLLVVVIVGAPALRVVVDLLFGGLAPKPRDMGVAYLAALYRIVYLLIAQAIAIPLLLLVFPVGLFLLLFNVLEAIMWLLGRSGAQPDFMLCRWVKLDGAHCALAVAAFHALQLVLVYAIMKHGGRLMEVAADRYARGVARIEGMGDGRSSRPRGE